MSITTKSGKAAKKSACKLASPICNDRAEAFVGPQAAVCPRFSEVPSERDKRAFVMQARRMTQREIAKELGCSQSTVHRAILKYRYWFGSTLPEDRGEITGFAKFRIALEEHRLFLLHQQELSMQEWEASRRSTVNSKTTKVYPEGRKSNGAPVKEEVTQEQVRLHGARVSHFNAATRLSREILMLEAGHIGVHRMTCDLAMDVDERDRWGRERTTADATIAEQAATIAGLTQKLAELEAKLAATQSGSGVIGAEVADSGESLAPKTEVPGSLDESRMAETTPALNQASPAAEVASPNPAAPSGKLSASPPPAAQEAESDESRPPSPRRNPPTPTYVSVLGPGRRLIWLKKPEN